MPLEAALGDVPWDIVADRPIFRKEDRKRIVDSLEMALRAGQGKMDVHAEGRTQRFSSALQCPACDISYRQPTANTFSFNSPAGACPICRGFGRIIDVDMDLVVPDPGKSIRDGAVKPWAGIARAEFKDLLDFCRRRRIPVTVPWRELSGIRRGLSPRGTTASTACGDSSSGSRRSATSCTSGCSWPGTGLPQLSGLRRDPFPGRGPALEDRREEHGSALRHDRRGRLALRRRPGIGRAGRGLGAPRGGGRETPALPDRRGPGLPDPRAAVKDPFGRRGGAGEPHEGPGGRPWSTPSLSSTSPPWVFTPATAGGS